MHRYSESSIHDNNNLSDLNLVERHDGLLCGLREAENAAVGDSDNIPEACLR